MMKMRLLSRNQYRLMQIRIGESHIVLPTSNSTLINISRPESPDPVELLQDDTAVRNQPSRYIDYLLHN